MLWPCDLYLWPLTLKRVSIVARGVGNLPTNFVVSRTFRSRLIGQHLSDASRDLATFTVTFDLGDHGACRWYGSSCSVCFPSLNFVGLPVPKILGIYCVSINPPGDLDLWPLNSETVPFLVYTKIIFYTKFEYFGDHSFSSYAADKQTDKQTDSKILPTPIDRVGEGNKNVTFTTNGKN